MNAEPSVSEEEFLLRFKKGQESPKGDWKMCRKKTIVPLLKMEHPFECESREGTLRGEPGDWLAQDGHGGFYPISEEFWSNNYEIVEDEK